MAGFPLLVVQEPRDDDFIRRDWRAMWPGQVLTLFERQLRCSLRLYRTYANFERLGFFDVTLGMVYLKPGSQYGRVLPPALTTRMVVVAPPRASLPLWTQMAGIFSRRLWYCVLATYLATSLVWYAIGRVRGWTPRSSLRRSLADMLVALLSMEWPRGLTQRASAGAAERCHVGAVALLSLVLSTLYQSAVVDVVCHPYQTPAIITLEDLDRSGLIIYHTVPHIISELIGGADSRRRLAEKFIEVPEDKKSTVQFMTQVTGDFAYVTNELVLKTIAPDNGKTLSLQVVQEPLFKLYTSFAVPLRSPFAEAMNVANLRIMQAGIYPDFAIHLQLITEKFSITSATVMKKVLADTSVKYFSINDVRKCLYILGFCLLLDTLVLVAELVSVTQFCQEVKEFICLILSSIVVRVRRTDQEL